jgi:hypothetical protein
MAHSRFLPAIFLTSVVSVVAADLAPLPPLARTARLALSEDWSAGAIDAAKWYSPRKKWGAGNHGVTRDNVRIERHQVAGREQSVLVCQANGDHYDGPIVGLWGKKARVGGAIVSREFFASGRFEIVMKIGSGEPHPGGPSDPRRPKGAVPTIWTYAYRFISVPRERMHEFVPEIPLYNPHMPAYGTGANEYWSELDFPEFGKDGDFDHGLYNTFTQNRHEPKPYDVSRVIDGQFHTYTTEWRTTLRPIDGVSDTQVTESEGFWCIKDKAIPFEKYLGNPLKRLGPDRYALYSGERVDHWIDGAKVAENTRFVPSMAAQLTMGVWLPDWAGEAPWKTATVSFASVKVWQFDDPGDARGVLTKSLNDNFDASGRALRE